MKDWKFKYMNEEQIAEVDKLWNEGHADALLAFGLECGDAGIKGYKRSCTTAALIGAGLGVAYLVAKRVGKKILDNYVEKKVQEERTGEVLEE